MKKYIVIHNLNSRGKNLSKNYIGKLLNDEDINFQYFATKSIDELDSIISKYNDGSKYQYCAVGGDGSLNSLVNSLMKNNVVKPEVACLPAGSGSDFVRTFALPQNIENAVKHLNSKSYYEVDIGRVETKQNKKYDSVSPARPVSAATSTRSNKQKHVDLESNRQGFDQQHVDLDAIRKVLTTAISEVLTKRMLIS